MAKVGLSMVRSFGVPITMEYFVNGLFGGISQELGRTTMENLCMSIARGDKELFEETLSNNGFYVASFSFPVGNPYTDVSAAWNAVMGISIEMNGDINSSGSFTAVPAYLLLPFGNGKEGQWQQTQYTASIIRMEFEEISKQTDMALVTSNIVLPESRASATKQSYFLKSVEFFFDF